MSDLTDAARVIEQAFTVIAGDEVASLVEGPLQSAWNGRTFDENVLREALAQIAQEEAAS